MAAVLFTAMLSNAQDHTIVVRGSASSVKGNTEVRVEQSNESDSVMVSPGVNVSDILITVKNGYGEIIGQQQLSAYDNSEITISTSDYSGGTWIEIDDNKIKVYWMLD